MSENNLWMLAGLGNPGKNYEATRHNIGFMVLDALASETNISFDKNKSDIHFGRGRLKNIPVILAKPMKFMNLSGIPLKKLADFFKIPKNNIIIIHDDVDIHFGSIKIKQKGGHGGHNGVRSIMETFGGGDFIRLRIGVGRPESETMMTGHVLGSFNEYEQNFLDKIIHTSNESVKTILLNGVTESMNRFNNKQILP
jgi:PTH1 family peptidyl-tRNA hydrolase